MTIRSWLIVALLTTGCAHVTGPPPATEMVEIPSDPSAPPPPTRQTLRAKTKMTRRQALLTSGIVIGSVGVVLTALGTGFFIDGREVQRAEEAECAADPDPSHFHLFCGFGGGLESAAGGIMLGVGLPTLITGFGLTIGGAVQKN